MTHRKSFSSELEALTKTPRKGFWEAYNGSNRVGRRAALLEAIKGLGGSIRVNAKRCANTRDRDLEALVKSGHLRRARRSHGGTRCRNTYLELVE